MGGAFGALVDARSRRAGRAWRKRGDAVLTDREERRRQAARRWRAKRACLTAGLVSTDDVVGQRDSSPQVLGTSTRVEAV